LPVLWISGASGAGKSVLALQLAQALLASGDIEAVSWLESYASLLPDALTHANTEKVPVLIQGDDLFAPENRDPVVWDNVGRRALSGDFHPRTAILTCGPTEHFRAFERQVHRHSGLRLVALEIPNFDAVERDHFHEWYQEYTQSQVPRSNDPIILVATWIYELHREEAITPKDFAIRFDDRLHELGLGDIGRTCLALNLYGLPAPDILFQNNRAALHQLFSEGVWRLSTPTLQNSAGRFFHPAVCRLVYEALVPQSEHTARAVDMARGFSAMLAEGAAADAFLQWIGANRQGGIRSIGAALLEEKLRAALLRALWDECFAHQEPTTHVTPRLLYWHQALVRSEIPRPPAATTQIGRWWEATHSHELPWPLLYQMVWDDADPNRRQEMFQKGVKWANHNCESGAWHWLYRRIFTHRPADEDIRFLGIFWLHQNLEHPYFSSVWRGLVDTIDRKNLFEYKELIKIALKAIPIQPTTPADFPMWKRTAELGAENKEICRAVFCKAARRPNPYKLRMVLMFYDGGLSL